MKPATPQTLVSFVKLASKAHSCSYNDENKAKFHRWGKAVAQLIADKMELIKGTYDIRSNQGGIACSGEITLHGESIYISMEQSCCLTEQFMFRKCKGKKDYAGMGNHWMTWQELLDIDSAVEKFIKVALNG